MSKSGFREISITSLAILLTIATAKSAASLDVNPVIAQSPTSQMPTTVPSGTTGNIDGSSSMTVINQTFKQWFERQFSNTEIQQSQLMARAIATSPVAPIASPQAIAAPTSVSTTPDSNPKIDETLPGALWWLALPVLGGLLWWLLKRSSPDSVASPVMSSVASPVVAAKTVPDSRIILVPRTCKTAYAYWEVPEVSQEALRRQGGEALTLRLYDVTDIDPETQSAHSVQHYECDARSPDYHLPIPLDNRDYAAELGYLTGDNRWLQLARSVPIHVPACPVLNTIPSTVKKDVLRTANRLEEEATSVESVDVASTSANSTIKETTVARIQHYGNFTSGDAATVQRYGKSNVEQAIKDDGADNFSTVTSSLPKDQFLRSGDYSAGNRAVQNNRIILVPRSAKNAYVYWEISSADRELIKQQGGTKLTLKVYEITNIDMDEIAVHSMQQFECNEQQQDYSVAIPIGDRDYVAEIGYATVEGYWLSIIRSMHVRVPAA